MRPFLAALMIVLAIATLGPRPAVADEPADSIRAVIEDQIAAFQRSDVTAAFEHAAPNVRRLFGSAQAFGRMVETGYPMIWRPARHQVQGLEETPLGLIQTVLFEDGAGRVFQAAYLMVQLDGAWRIAGVELSAVPGIGV